MNVPILATKLYLPQPPQKEVQRPRLVEQLNRGLHRKLSLISAPAGFGKTTLVSEWAADCNRNTLETAVVHTAWLSLEEADSDPTRFLTYLVAAFQTIAPNIGEESLDILRSAQQAPIELVLIALLNDLTTISNKNLLVLDDYHVIDSQKVDEAVTYLIEHLPPTMHLVITTREDPQLPLARLRARGQLTELRASDLRFTPVEAADFLAGMGITLSPADVSVLEARTEGWIAGLQLAALALQGSQDIAGFIQAFAGDHRYIMDYLLEEVLQRQPQATRKFLLQTSILSQLNGPLCDAVTGQADGSAQLEILERGNFFVVPLDNQRRWYRYHHLFADVLYTNLIAEQPDQVTGLHRRASVWYEQQGATSDAVRHALAAEDFARAAVMIERAFPEMSRRRQEPALLEWLKALPEALVRNHPVLCNLYAGALMQTGEMEGVESWLQAAERWLTPMIDRVEGSEVPSLSMIVVDQEEFRRLPGWVALHRAGQALMLGNVDDTIRHAQRVLDLAPQDDFLRLGGAAALQGLAFWSLGDLGAARQIYPDSIANLQRAGYLSDAIGCTLALADIIITQGHLHEAMKRYEQALQLAADRGEPTMRGTADMLVGMSELYYEWNDLPAAAQLLMSAKEQGEHTGLPQNRYRWCVVMARIRRAKGDLNGAVAFLDEAERLYMSDFSPNVRPVSAMKARLLAEHGRLDEAIAWARTQKLNTLDDLDYLHEYAYITLARILLARCRRDHDHDIIPQAASLLDRLLKAAETGGRVRSVIEINILQALIRHEQGDIQAALSPLEQALALAEPDGFTQIFLEEGLPMEHLLREAWLHQYRPNDTRRLLDAFGETHQQGFMDESPDTNASEVSAPIPKAVHPVKTALIEPLSQRELDVLRLFQTELSGPEIAQELMIALSTVRTYTKSVYSKLNVNSRRAAVKRATELHLI